MAPSKSRQPIQLSLFETEFYEAAKESNGSAFSDPAFAGNKSLPIHRWVPWIAGFSGDFVADLIRKNLGHKGVVLDPFAGVGTTLVEAVLNGHKAIGFEINPYAALACRAKLYAFHVSVETLRSEMEKLASFLAEKLSSNETPQSIVPKGFQTRSPFYSPRVLRKVLFLQDFINAIRNPGIQGLFRLAFASTMVRYSNYSYEPSLGRRKSAGKDDIRDFPVVREIVQKLEEMAEDITWYQGTISKAQMPEAQVIHESFFQYRSFLPPSSVDLVITSPPYLNNYHYNRNTRPQLYWLGYVQHPKDLKPLEHANFGKYWQTVRDQPNITLKFSLPGSDLEERLKTIREQNPEKGIYGGRGWANYAAAYFNDCYDFAEALDHLLTPGGKAFVVIGNSILQGVLIPTDQYFGEIVEAVGLEVVRIEIPRATRVGNSIIQSDVRVAKAKGWHRLYEAVVEVRKA